MRRKCVLGYYYSTGTLRAPGRGCLSVTGEHRLAYQQTGSSAMVSRRVGAKCAARKLDACIKIEAAQLHFCAYSSSRAVALTILKPNCQLGFLNERYEMQIDPFNKPKPFYDLLEQDTLSNQFRKFGNRSPLHLRLLTWKWSCLNLNILQLFISVKDFFSLDLFNFAFSCTFAPAAASASRVSVNGRELEKQNKTKQKKTRCLKQRVVRFLWEKITPWEWTAGFILHKQSKVKQQ